MSSAVGYGPVVLPWPWLLMRGDWMLSLWGLLIPCTLRPAGLLALLSLWNWYLNTCRSCCSRSQTPLTCRLFVSNCGCSCCWWWTLLAVSLACWARYVTKPNWSCRQCSISLWEKPVTLGVIWDSPCNLQWQRHYKHAAMNSYRVMSRFHREQLLYWGRWGLTMQDHVH